MSTQAKDVRAGQLVGHEVSGENIGVEIRHVEPSEDGARVLLVFVGGETRWCDADEDVELLSLVDSRAAQERLRRRERKAEVLRALRVIADAGEAGMPLPVYHLDMHGTLQSAEEVAAVATALGAEVDTSTPGHWSVTCRFGGDKYSAAVEFRLSYVDRSATDTPPESPWAIAPKAESERRAALLAEAERRAQRRAQERGTER